MKNTSQTPFEKLVDGLFSLGSSKKVENIHPEDFKIIMDSIYALFFGFDNKQGRRLGIEGMTDYEGVRIEFSKKDKLPHIRRDRENNYKVIVLPDVFDSREEKIIAVKEALKEFDCLETIEKYELCLRVLQSFSRSDLVVLAREYDPYKRDLKKLEKRFLDEEDLIENKQSSTSSVKKSSEKNKDKKHSRKS